MPTNNTIRRFSNFFEHVLASLDLASPASHFMELARRFDVSRHPSVAISPMPCRRYAGTSLQVLLVDDLAVPPFRAELTRALEWFSAPIYVGVDWAHTAPTRRKWHGDWPHYVGIDLGVDDGWMRYRHVSPRFVPTAVPEVIEQQLQRGDLARAILEPPALPLPQVPPVSEKARRAREAARHIRAGRVVLPSEGRS